MPYKDPAVAKAKRHEYYLRNRNRIKARVRQYRADHAEERREYARRHYRENSDRYKENVGRWQQEHPEKVKGYKRKWDRENREYRARYVQEHQFPYHGILDEAGVERRCVECGAVDGLCVHHIDGNHGNDSLDNLQWMCMSCHSRLHARVRKEKCLPEATECPSGAREDAPGASAPGEAPEAEEGAAEAREEVS